MNTHKYFHILAFINAALAFSVVLLYRYGKNGSIQKMHKLLSVSGYQMSLWGQCEKHRSIQALITSHYTFLKFPKYLLYVGVHTGGA